MKTLKPRIFIKNNFKNVKNFFLHLWWRVRDTVCV